MQHMMNPALPNYWNWILVFLFKVAHFIITGKACQVIWVAPGIHLSLAFIWCVMMCKLVTLMKCSKYKPVPLACYKTLCKNNTSCRPPITRHQSQNFGNNCWIALCIKDEDMTPECDGWTETFLWVYIYVLDSGTTSLWVCFWMGAEHVWRSFLSVSKHNSVMVPMANGWNSS